MSDREAWLVLSQMRYVGSMSRATPLLTSRLLPGTWLCWVIVLGLLVAGCAPRDAADDRDRPGGFYGGFEGGRSNGQGM